MQRRTTAVNTDRYALLGAAYDFGVARAALLLSTRHDDLPAATSGQGRFYEASVTVPMGMAGQWLLSHCGHPRQAPPPKRSPAPDRAHPPPPSPPPQPPCGPG